MNIEQMSERLQKLLMDAINLAKSNQHPSVDTVDMLETIFKDDVLDGLFELEVEAIESELDSSLFNLFEKEFKRPLTQKEMETVSDWIKRIDSNLIIEALRYASMYKKVKLSYIDKILKNWVENNVTLAMIEEGKYIDN